MRLSVLCGVMLVWTGSVTAQEPSPMLPVQAADRPGTTAPATSPSAEGSSPARQEQIDAATTDAVTKLMADISTVQLTDQLSIGALVAQTDSRDAFRAVVRQANQIGGVRWLDGQTAQVQLEIGGDQIEAEVRRLVRIHSDKLKVTAAELEPALVQLARKTFVATGSSTTVAVIENVKPAGQDAWVGVDEESRRAAIAAAKDQAVDSVLDSIRDVRLSDGRTMGSLLSASDSTVRLRLREHLATRPVTSVKFHESREVEVTLSAPPVETFAVIRNALIETGSANLTDAEWDRLRREFLEDISAATGRGVIPRAEMALPIQPQVELPQQPPIWVGDMLDVQGTAEPTETKLKTARAAERQALADLRAQVLELPLTPDLKIGEAASKDPDIAAAVDRAIARARTYKSDYYADGRVVVRTSLDLRDVWEQLHQRQP